ncbi:sensor histidine kinase [Auritidibacter ignavus]|uniref:Histidine kinase n=1 Tax=Auritidibacter ignavus TaxID=678932 RepID=A0AAJ6ANF3_9MICC|nr:histidine kinase [Auritidibacter ignavus]WGH83883.1 histidine kinase [Auritidibacter ignavus]WGH86230.1 histidine kinase [Auritidibacter ignavus]WGH88514.1 histidine kinase [Auritidibacter ignavus]WGH93205.1 histidine kinase [Auritidibacter ignavus]
MYPDQLSQEEQREQLRYGGGWLALLLIPATSVVLSDHPLWAKIAGIACLVLFAGCYLWMLTHPRPWPLLPRVATTLVYTLVLGLLVVPVALLTGADAGMSLTFVAALWLFTHNLVPGAIGSFVSTTLAGTALLMISDQMDLWWPLLLSLTLAWLMLFFIRYVVERQEVERQVSERDALAAQREELDRQVHDVLGQSLTAITVKTQLAMRLLDTDHQAARAELESILGLARSSISNVRTAITTLEAPDLGNQLEVALEMLRNQGIHVTTTEIPRQIAPATAELFAWCLREAVTNVLRHAQASTVNIEITTHRLRVSDDGIGITRPTTGYGLAGLRHRAEAAKGTLTISSSDRGTVLEVSQ